MSKDNEPVVKHITNNFYGPIGQYIQHVEHNHFGMTDEGNFHFDDADGETAQHRLFPDLPTQETMCQAVAAAVRDGLWYGNQAWAVVFRAYQLKGYLGGMSEFVREVKAWPMEMAATCSYDAVQK